MAGVQGRRPGPHTRPPCQLLLHHLDGRDQRRGFTIEAFGRLGGFALAPFDLEYARLRLTGHRPEDAHPLRRLLGLLVEPLANRSRVSQYRCERWWGHWLGFDEIYVVIRALKDEEELRRRRLLPAAPRRAPRPQAEQG